jgi:hypothetical protein
MKIRIQQIYLLNFSRNQNLFHIFDKIDYHCTNCNKQDNCVIVLFVWFYFNFFDHILFKITYSVSFITMEQFLKENPDHTWLLGYLVQPEKGYQATTRSIEITDESKPEVDRLVEQLYSDGLALDIVKVRDRNIPWFVPNVKGKDNGPQDGDELNGYPVSDYFQSLIDFIQNQSTKMGKTSTGPYDAVLYFNRRPDYVEKSQ